MNFLYPTFLLALFAVSIPILIHLFNFRRFKKLYFSDVRFLKEIKQQTQNKNRIKHLLVLISRILVVTFLVLAFAQPYIPADNKNTIAGMQAVSIFVDNSFSMENISKNGMLLDEAKRMARETALSYSPSDLFQLLTNDFQEKHQRLVNREEFLTLLDEVKISPAVRSISEIYARQADVFSHTQAKARKTFIISDFQKTICDFENIKSDSSLRTILLPISANQQNNLYIDSCWFESPVIQLNQNTKLHVRILSKNHNEDLLNQPIKLFINNQQKTFTTFTVKAGSSIEVVLPFVLKETGIQRGRIEITDYPVTYDDKFYFSFNVSKNIKVACITSFYEQEETKSLQSLYGKDSLFIFTIYDENKIDYSALASQQVIILNGLKVISSGLAQEIMRFVQKGGSLVVFPSVESDTYSYKAFLSSMECNYFLRKDTSDTKVDWINYDSEIFNDVFEKDFKNKTENIDLPVVRNRFSISRFSRINEETLMKVRNGESFISAFFYKKGKIYLSAVALTSEWSNLARHAIFVPLMYKVAMNSQPSYPLFYIVGQNKPIFASFYDISGNTVFRIKGENNFEVIPEIKMTEQQSSILVHEQINKAGNYLLFAGEQPLLGISFNNDRKESDLTCYSVKELISKCESAGLKNFSLIDVENKNVAKTLADISMGKKLWKWCIFFSLLFLATEVLLLRFLK